MECRSFLTLDADEAEPCFLEHFAEHCKHAAAIYTTHGSTPQDPRVRIIVPFEKDISPDCYVAVARYYAAEWGIDQFDDCSFRVNQLMFWPTTPADVEYVCKVIPGPFLNAMEYLEQHPNWRDCSMLPASSRSRRCACRTAGSRRILFQRMGRSVLSADVHDPGDYQKVPGKCLCRVYGRRPLRLYSW